MKKTIFMACAMAMLVACSNNSNSSGEKKSNEKIEEVFMDYVKTDFGNPKDFVEITQFGESDTIANLINSAKKSIDKAKWMFPKDFQLKIERIRKRMDSCRISIIQHTIKVRVKTHDGGMNVREYYVIEDGDKWHTQDHPLTMDEMPDIYKESFDLMNEMTRRVDAIMRSMDEATERILGSGGLQ